MPGPATTSERERDWALLLAACRVGSPGLAERVAERFGKAMAAEWSSFLRLMDEQGTGPLAASALLEPDEELLPGEVRTALAERVRLANLRAAVLVDELLAIVDAFEKRGIEVVAHKGPALSLLAYGRVGVRDSVDLDLVVRESDVDAAERVLRGRGYRRHSPGDLRPRVEAAWRRAWNETEFVSADDWVFVDLHWRICPERFPFRVDAPGLWRGLGRAPLGGRGVPVFRPEAQVVLLSVHGAKDRWERLVWLCDLDRLVRTSPTLEWDDVLGTAEEARCVRATALGLVLALNLLGTPLPPAVRSLPALASVGPLAARLGVELAEGRPRPRGPLARIGVTPFQLEVFDGRGDAVRYAYRSLVTPMAWDFELERIRLPDTLYGLYYPLRVARLLLTPARDYVRRLFRTGTDGR
jgi:hypothetical protein